MASRDCSRCPVGGTFDPVTYVCSVADPADGLPVTCVGEWAEEKHERVRRYVDISRSVRAKFTKNAGASFIDLYAGPGRSRIKYTERLIDGSALTAAKTASEPYSSFSTVHVGDTNSAFLQAAKTRLSTICGHARTYQGAAEDTVNLVCQALSSGELNVAFLDPYDLGSLPFSILEQLGHESRMDVIIHVSLHDLQRNLERYYESADSPLDRFSPGWRKHVDPKTQTKSQMRHAVLNYWKAKMQSAGLTAAQVVERVTGSRNQNLYWLVFAAGHPLANRFWDEIRDIDPQRPLI